MKLMITLDVLTIIIILYMSTETSSTSAMDRADHLKCRLFGRMKHLRHYGDKKTANLTKQVNEFKGKTIQLMQERGEYDLQEILRKIDREGKKGPAADVCYESAETNFKAIMQSLNTTECDSVDLSDATFLQANVSLINMDGRGIIDRINEGIISCVPSGERDFETCVKNKFAHWRNSTINIRERIEALIGKSASIGIVQGDSFTIGCFGRHSGALFGSYINKKTKAYQCIAEI